MFLKGTRLESQGWVFNSRNTPIVSLAVRPENYKLNMVSVFFLVDGLFLAFHVSRFRWESGYTFRYSATEEKSDSIFVETGEFQGFDSVSSEFRGLRFHWSRESGKIMISDAFAGRREFQALTIE